MAHAGTTVMPTLPGWYLVEVAGLVKQPESGFAIDYCRQAAESDGGGMQWVDHYRHNVVAWYLLPVRLATLDKVAKDRYEEIAKVRVALGSVVNQDAIDPWLWTKNDVFGCRPIDMIGTDREHEIYHMIERLESGDPA